LREDTIRMCSGRCDPRVAATGKSHLAVSASPGEALCSPELRAQSERWEWDALTPGLPRANLRARESGGQRHSNCPVPSLSQTLTVCEGRDSCQSRSVSPSPSRSCAESDPPPATVLTGRAIRWSVRLRWSSMWWCRFPGSNSAGSARPSPSRSDSAWELPARTCIGPRDGASSLRGGETLTLQTPRASSTLMSPLMYKRLRMCGVQYHIFSVLCNLPARRAPRGSITKSFPPPSDDGAYAPGPALREAPRPNPRFDKR
jgi:hypothetical protein